MVSRKINAGIFVSTHAPEYMRQYTVGVTYFEYDAVRYSSTSSNLLQGLHISVIQKQVSGIQLWTCEHTFFSIIERLSKYSLNSTVVPAGLAMTQSFAQRFLTGI